MPCRLHSNVFYCDGHPTIFIRAAASNQVNLQDRMHPTYRGWPKVVPARQKPAVKERNEPFQAGAKRLLSGNRYASAAVNLKCPF